MARTNSTPVYGWCVSAVTPPGSQMVVVETGEGRVVLTGDAVPTHRNYVDNLPSGILVDLLELIDARRTVKALAPRFLYTGHDLAERLDCADMSGS